MVVVVPLSKQIFRPTISSFFFSQQSRKGDWSFFRRLNYLKSATIVTTITTGSCKIQAFMDASEGMATWIMICLGR